MEPVSNDVYTPAPVSDSYNTPPADPPPEPAPGPEVEEIEDPNLGSNVDILA